MESENLLIENLKNSISNQLGWGNHENWKNKDFEDLSEKIFEKTNVQLSAVTLKRIWGKLKYDSAPTVNTLNTLAQFVGYENWRDFRNQNMPISQHGSADPSPRNEQPELNANQPLIKKINYGAIAALLIFIGVLFLSFITGKSVKRSKLSSDDFAFSSKKVITTGVPNSVIFEYDASKSPTDSVFIQQSWNKDLSTQVPKNQNQHTSIYYYPGYFKAKLVVGDKIMKEHDLFIQSNGWIPFVEQKPVPIYLDSNDLKKDGVMGLSIENIKSYNIQLQPNTPVVRYSNVRDFGSITSDEFVLETSIRSEYNIGVAVCQKVWVSILCEGSAITIPLSKKGCISENSLFVLGESISGKSNDLSGFGVDFDDFVVMKSVASRSQILFYVNNEIVYQVKNPLLNYKIVGIVYRFQGTGSVDYVKLSEGSGKVVYQEDF